MTVIFKKGIRIAALGLVVALMFASFASAQQAEPKPNPEITAKSGDKETSEKKKEDSETEEPQTTDDAQKLAKELANPVASLISFPLISAFDFGMGPDGKGFRYTLSVQPVIPFKLNKDWNLISRTIVPIIAQSDVVARGSNQFGLGDTVQAFFFSPNKAGPFVWGIGPQILIPTATNANLGTQKLGLGPTGLILKQIGPWTLGTLASHTWSVAGKSSRADVSSTFLNPFMSYSTKSGWTIALSPEATYDWKAEKWVLPIHSNVSKLVMFGKRPVSIGAGVRCWAVTTPTGPSGCGFRILVTPLFPKK